MTEQSLEHPVEKRQLAAILAADVVGYSKMMEAGERETLRLLRDLRAGLIQPAVDEHHGRIFKTMGDGFLVEFSSVVDAVHCAVDIQRALAARNLAPPDTGRTLLRIGVNIGDVFHEGDDVFGDGVNVAARMEALAPPGGICVTRAVREQVREKLNFDFADLGEHQVKNISRPIRVYGISFEGAPAAPWSARARPGIVPLVAGLALICTVAALALFLPFQAKRPAPWSSEDRRMSFAVLPFSSADGETISEDLTTMLAGQRFAGWVLPTAQVAGSDRSGSPAQIGKRLNVEFLVQGATRLDGDLTVVQASLIEASSGRIIGTEKMIRPPQASRTMIDDRLASLAETLVREAKKSEVARVAATPESQWDARDWLISTWPIFWQPSKQLVQDMLRRTERALALAPDEPRVIAETGKTYAYALANGFSNDPTFDHQRAQSLLKKALDKNSEEPTAWFGLGLLFTYDNDWENAEIANKKLLSIAPYFTGAVDNLATNLVLLGRAQECLDLMKQHDSSLFDFYDYAMMGQALMILGNFPEAERNLRTALIHIPPDAQKDSQGVQTILALASVQGAMGYVDEAKRNLSILSGVQDAATISAVVKGLGNRLPAYSTILLDGLRKAGLPEQ